MSPKTLERLLYSAALLAGVAPLWAGATVPMVDLPQHLHLISALHRLGDPSTLYPQFLEARGQLTPYLGYYYAVSLLNWLVPVELANRLFLSTYVAGMALGLAYLLRALSRPTWPSLLALPFAYGDSFGWGFVNYCSALPLALVCLGLFVRAIDQPARRRAYGLGLSAALVAVLLFHVQVFAFLGLALPLLLLTTPAPDDPKASWRARLSARRWALAGVVPGVAAFVAWVGLRLGQPSEVAYGEPWKAWGPLLSPQNLSYKTFQQNLSELTVMPANLLTSGADRWAFWAAIGVALAAMAAAAVPALRAQAPAQGLLARVRLPALALVALALYFTLPFDVRGYMYYLNTRYVHLAGPLLLASVPALAPRAERALRALAAGVAVLLGVALWQGFAAFNAESAGLAALVQATGDKPRVMGLIFNAGSRVVRHPVYLHVSTLLARARGGITNFSFALTPHSPLKYRGTPPPTFPSEWNAGQMSWEAHGQHYDHFVVRGAPPQAIFGARLNSELYVAAQAQDFTLVRKR